MSEPTFDANSLPDSVQQRIEIIQELLRYQGTVDYGVMQNRAAKTLGRAHSQCTTIGESLALLRNSRIVTTTA